MAGAADHETELQRARDLGVDTCGRIAEFWGFTRTMGRAFGLLYLSREPLAQSEIQARLGISAGREKYWNERVAFLREFPTEVRWISVAAGEAGAAAEALRAAEQGPV